MEYALRLYKSLQMNYREHISIDPNVRFGKPCITGTRITVYDVLQWMAAGMTLAAILEDFPELTELQIRACLAYAADREQNVHLAA